MPETMVAHHATYIKDEISDLVLHLRRDILKVNDPRTKALCEVSADVLVGLRKAFDDYEKENEAAWKE